MFEYVVFNSFLSNFKFCLYYKDFMLGKIIFDNVIDCVEVSCYIVIVLLKYFLNSYYCMYEFYEVF